MTTKLVPKVTSLYNHDIILILFQWIIKQNYKKTKIVTGDCNQSGVSLLGYRSYYKIYQCALKPITLPWLTSTHFCVPRKFFHSPPPRQKNYKNKQQSFSDIFRIFALFLSFRGDYNERTQHTVILNKIETNSLNFSHSPPSLKFDCSTKVRIKLCGCTVKGNLYCSHMSWKHLHHTANILGHAYGICACSDVAANILSQIWACSPRQRLSLNARKREKTYFLKLTCAPNKKSSN